MKLKNSLTFVLFDSSLYEDSILNFKCVACLHIIKLLSFIK